MLAAVAVGGVGFLAYTGTVFFLGFDALAIGLGWTFGMLLAGILFVPYLRKAGSYTLPSFLGHRFRSRGLRMAASVMQLPPTALLVVAEIKIAALIAALFLPISFSIAVLVLVALIAAIAILGGMRSLTWTGKRRVPGRRGRLDRGRDHRLDHAHQRAGAATDLWRDVLVLAQCRDHRRDLRRCVPGGLATALPGAMPAPTVKPFLQPFGSLGPMDFVTLFLCLALGTAALPSLLVRSGVTSSIADQRRSTAWGLLFVALFVMTAPAIAAFAKLIIFRDIALASASSLPVWLTELADKHLLQAADANGDGAIGAAELLIGRDGIALALPWAAGLPYVPCLLMATAALAIALAAAAAHLFTLAASLAEDLYRVLDRGQALPRLIAAWAAIAACSLAAAMFLMIAEVDPLKAALTAFAFAARELLPGPAACHLVAAMHQMGCVRGDDRRLSRGARRAGRRRHVGFRQRGIHHLAGKSDRRAAWPCGGRRGKSLSAQAVARRRQLLRGDARSRGRGHLRSGAGAHGGASRCSSFGGGRSRAEPLRGNRAGAR